MSAFLGATESLLSSNKLSPCVQIEHDECHVSATDGMVSPASAACERVESERPLFELVVLLSITAAWTHRPHQESSKHESSPGLLLSEVL